MLRCVPLSLERRRPPISVAVMSADVVPGRVTGGGGTGCQTALLVFSWLLQQLGETKYGAVAAHHVVLFLCIFSLRWRIQPLAWLARSE